MKLEKIFGMGHTIATDGADLRIVELVDRAPWPDGFYRLREEALEDLAIRRAVDPQDLDERIDPEGSNWLVDKQTCWCTSCRQTRRFQQTSFEEHPAELGDAEPASEPTAEAATDDVDERKKEIMGHFRRALAQSAKGAHREAIAAYSQILSLDSEYAMAYANRGGSHATLKEHRQAVEDYDRALKLDPTLAKTWANRGVSRASLKELPAAVEDYTRAIELDPKLAMAFYSRGNANAKLGEYLEAIADYERFLELAGKTPLTAKARDRINRCQQELGTG